MTFRTRVFAALDPLLRSVGLYSAYALSTEEFVGRVSTGIRGARRHLREREYSRHWLAAAKRHPRTGELDDGSYRRIPTEHPPNVAGTDLADYAPRDCQYHVHFFQTDRGVEVYSHYELRPLLHPREHYRPRYASTYLKGVTDLIL